MFFRTQKHFFMTCMGAIVLLSAIMLFKPAHSTHAQAYYMCNATEKKVITTWGGSAYITWRNPNLNGGEFSYHRVSTVNSSARKFVEWGPAKTDQFGFVVLLAWDANDGLGVQNEVYFEITPATHRYSHQYDPNTGMYWFFVDGVNIAHLNAGFSYGNYNGAGGEAADCLEKFNSTKLSSLRYLTQVATFEYFGKVGQNS